MVFEYILTALSLSVGLLSLITLKLTLPDIVRKVPDTQAAQSRSLSYLDTVRFLLKRFTLVEFFMVRKALHKHHQIMFLGLTMVFSALISSTMYWSWAIGTLVSAGIYLITELAMEMKDSSHENTYWKRTLVYSIMTLITISCSAISVSFSRFANLHPMNFLKSMVVSVSVDELVGRPILILILSLVLQQSGKMKRLIRRYEYLEANINIIGTIQQPSQQDIRSRAERLPLEEIMNEEVKYPLRIKNRLEKNGGSPGMGDEIDSRRSVKLRSGTRLPPVHLHLRRTVEDNDYGKENKDEEPRDLEFSLRDNVVLGVNDGNKEVVKSRNEFKEGHRKRRLQRLREKQQKKEQKKELRVFSWDDQLNSSKPSSNTPHNNNVDDNDEIEEFQKVKENPVAVSQMQPQDQEGVIYCPYSRRQQKQQEDGLGEYEIISNERQRDIVGQENNTCNQGGDDPFVSQINGVTDCISEDQHMKELMKVLGDDVVKDPGFFKDTKDTCEGKNEFLPEEQEEIVETLDENDGEKRKQEQGGTSTLQQKHPDIVRTVVVENDHQHSIDDIPHLNQPAPNLRPQNKSPQPQIQQLQLIKQCSPKPFKKLDIYSEGSFSQIQQPPLYFHKPNFPQKRNNKSINLSKTLEVVDADVQFVEQSTPKKIRSNSQDPNYPLKASKRIGNTLSQKSGLKKSILEITQTNLLQDDIQHIQLAPIHPNLNTKSQPKKVYKRKNFKTLFRGDSPYLQYLPNMLTKQIRGQCSEKKQKQNMEMGLDRNSRNMNTISYAQTLSVREF